MFDAIDRRTEDDLVDAIARDRLVAHVDALADLRRYPGSEDQWRAAEYVADELSAAGVAVEIETIAAYTSVPESATVTVTSPVRAVFDDAITTAFGASTPPGGVTGEVIHEPSIGDDPAALAHVEGTVVFTRGLPTPGPVGVLDAAGAAAVVFASPTPGQLHEMTVSPVWGSPSTDDADDLPALPVAEIHAADGDRLAERVAGDTVEATVETAVATEQRDLPCPIARIEGTASDRYLLFGNHLDAWHEGATDNATAVAASMEVARVVAENPPKRGLVVGFWPGHSMGRYAGSARFADDHWLDLRANGVAYLHADLNGLAGADRLWCQHMAAVADEHRDVLEDGPLPLGTGGGDGDLIEAGDRPGRNSDQSFWGAGLASLLSGARFSDGHDDGGPIGGGWWWHTPADTRDKVDFDLMTAEAERYTAIVSRFCNSPVLPHDFRTTAAEIRSITEEVEATAGDGLDFAPIHTQLDRLDAGLERFTATVEAVDEAGVAAEIEDVQVGLGNRLIPALYMASSVYEHDPALPHDRLPALRIAEELPDRHGPEAGFARTKATREITKVAHQVGEAADIVERFVANQS